jgi:hypothetical protein
VTPHLLLDIVVPATNAQEAQVAARAWAAAEPKIVLVRLTRVRPAVKSNGERWFAHWAVEFVYSLVQPGLGL